MFKKTSIQNPNSQNKEKTTSLLKKKVEYKEIIIIY